MKSTFHYSTNAGTSKCGNVFFFFFFFLFFFFFVSVVLYYTILEPSQEILALFVLRINTLQIRILGNQVGLDD